jgi:TRAP-type C4-dicarboxylate transport system permease small subunit
MLGILEKLNKTGLFLSKLSLVMACSGVFIMMVMITVNVLSRYLFNYAFDFVEEYSAFILVLVVFMGLGHVTRKDMHVRVDLFYNYLKEKTRVILDIFTFILSFIVAIIYVYSAFIVFTESLGMWETSIITNTPIWIPKFIMLFGTLVFSLEILNWIITLILRYIKLHSTIAEEREKHYV